MSVIIRRMKLPKNCWECKLEQFIDCDVFQGVTSASEYRDKRYANCPIIELPPHGDLIDYNFCLKNYELLHDDDGNPVYAVRMRDINAAPVIIEAEVSD